MMLVGVAMFALVGLPALLEGNSLAEAGNLIEAGPYRLIAGLGFLSGSGAFFGGTGILSLASRR